MALQAIFKPVGVYRRYHGLSLRGEQAQDSLLEWERVGEGISGHQAECEQSPDELNCCIRGLWQIQGKLFILMISSREDTSLSARGKGG